MGRRRIRPSQEPLEVGLSDDLRAGVSPIWEKVVTHPFVIEMGDGKLPRTAFYIYFDQDYLFIRAWVILLSLATAKAPDFDSARRLVSFLHLGLGGEERLFQAAFRERGMSHGAVRSLPYLPTTQNYSGYLRNVAYTGTYIDVIATLLVVDWPYLDWARRANQAGKRPNNHYYQTWIDLHASEDMTSFVGWLNRTVNESAPSSEQQAGPQEIFQNVLHYEYLFFEMAYRGVQWPD